MVKRFAFGVVAIVFVSMMVLLIWQPDSLKKSLLNHVAKKISESNSYEFTIGKVSGNLFTGIALWDIHILTKPDHIELLGVKTVKVGLSWWALLIHKTMVIKQLEWINPTLHIIIDRHGNLLTVAPTQPHSNPAGPAPVYAIRGMTLEGGRILVQNHSLSSEKELLLNDIALNATATNSEINIERLTLRLGNGRSTLKGRILFQPGAPNQLALVNENMELEKVAAAFFPVPAPLRLTHSGRCILGMDSQAITVDMQGWLDGSPVSFHGMRDPQGYSRTTLTWKNVLLHRLWQDRSAGRGTFSTSLDLSGKGMRLTGKGKMNAMLQDSRQAWSTWASASLTLSQGEGPYHVHIGTTNASADIQGQVNLPNQSVIADYALDISQWDILTGMVPMLQTLTGRVSLAGHGAKKKMGWSLEGHGTGNHLAWQGKSLEQATIGFTLTNRQEHIELSVNHLQLQQGQEKPIDIRTGTLSLDGASPRWKTALTVALANGSKADVSGELTNENESWRLTWQSLAMIFPGSGTWTAQPDGFAALVNNRRFEVHNLDMANGKQHIKLPQGIFEKASVHIDLEANALDPSPWIKLVNQDISLNGALDTSLHVHGALVHPTVDGFVNGKFKSFSLGSAGLSLENLELEILSKAQKLEIRRFSGKTKKGNVDITGGSILPALAYELHARELTVRPNPKSNAIGDMDLYLKGSIDHPVLTGHVDIKEGVYALPSKEKAKKAAPQTVAATEHASPSVWNRLFMDLTAAWPRNVWYRDGVTSVETRADLRIQKAADQSNIVLTGTLSSIRGTYSYYGRDFNLESGEIRFTGERDMNPLLNIEASYRRDPTVVYLDITGTANQPTLKMRSNPPLSEQDIVSVIVFGQPLNELRSRTGGQTTNQQALQAAGGVMGSYISKGLRQTGLQELNFDVLNIQPTPQGSELTVGRYLTRRLFVSYGQALRGSAEKSITADYFLTDKWTLQGASDSLQGNYLDFLFRYPLNKREAGTNNSPLPSSPFRNTLDQQNLYNPISR